MSQGIQIPTTVLPGHRIEVESSELPEGKSDTVLVLVNGAEQPKRRLSEVLAGYAGGQLFRSAEETDAYLRSERDAWNPE